MDVFYFYHSNLSGYMGWLTRLYKPS